MSDDRSPLLMGRVRFVALKPPPGRLTPGMRICYRPTMHVLKRWDPVRSLMVTFCNLKKPASDFESGMGGEVCPKCRAAWEEAGHQLDDLHARRKRVLS